MRFRRVLAATVIGLALSAVAGVQAAVDPPVEHSVCGFDPTPTTLTYRIGLLWNGGISEADQRTAIRAGVETWETTFDLSLVEVPYTPIVPDVMIHFAHAGGPLSNVVASSEMRSALSKRSMAT